MHTYFILGLLLRGNAPSSVPRRRQGGAIAGDSAHPRAAAKPRARRLRCPAPPRDTHRRRRHGETTVKDGPSDQTSGGDHHRRPPARMVAADGPRGPGRPPAHGRTRRRDAGPRARHAAFRLRPHAHRGERARPAGGDGAHGPALEGPLGAQEPARAEGAGAHPRARRARHSGVRRPRCLLAGRGRVRPLPRLPGDGDQLHRHQRERPRPRRGARARRARESRPHQPDPPIRATQPRGHDRPPRQPPHQRRPPRERITYYSGAQPTKFGIYPERPDEVIAVAPSYDLTIDTIHFHVSHHLLDDDLPAFERAVAAAAAMAKRVIDTGCPLREVNAGGGLAAVMRQGQRPLDLDAYAGILARHLGPLGVTIACEPGEMFCKNAGVLLAEVVTVEDRSAAGDGSAVFAGLTCGWNVMTLAFVYKELYLI